MSAVYWSRERMKDARLLDCPTIAVVWPYCRITFDVHWKFDEAAGCFQTHRWTKDAHYSDVRSWPGDTALTSFLAAIRGDDRMAGDPLLRLMAFYVTLEYLTILMGRVRL